MVLGCLRTSRSKLELVASRFFGFFFGEKLAFAGLLDLTSNTVKPIQEKDCAHSDRTVEDEDHLEKQRHGISALQ